MAKISDLSGDERAQRIAALKKKMQASAQKAQGAAVEEEATIDEAGSAETVAAPVAAATVMSVQSETAVIEAVAEAPAEHVGSATAEDDDTSDEDAGNVEATAAPASATNGASANGALAPAVVAGAPLIEEKSEEEKRRDEMNRREFLTYAWGASLGMLALGTGVVSFFFMYPRFKAGEFGGKFFMGPASAVPPTDAAPIGMSDGKFWWVNVEGEGPKALYMVCTHLGCLYKWVGENNRFECPCHGSKFTREGLYIEGPAPRSLDTFVVALEGDEYTVDTGAKINGAPSADSPAAGT